jgi:hypothetical protein
LILNNSTTYVVKRNSLLEKIHRPEGKLLVPKATGYLRSNRIQKENKRIDIPETKKKRENGSIKKEDMVLYGAGRIRSTR